ncbi:VOC family protein [Salininema proteolyticum]|uniref:VOC family protein n=1 Tax=Salininema proteolyticum TaxID=1607685 RepID=A0ABV8U3W6_9ACTN
MSKVNPIPEGYHSLTPFVVVDNAATAIDFYRAVFDAEVLSRNDAGDIVMHAELQIGDSILQLSDPMPSMGLVPPDPDNVSATLVLYVEDVDTVVGKAVEAGATLREEISEFVTGDRFGSIVDPFGRRWAVMTRVKDVPRGEAERLVNEWIASMAKGEADET